MHRFLLLTTIVGAAGLDSARGSADDSPYDALDPQVTRVVSGGSWEHAGRSGRYRAIVRTRCSPDHCYDDLFVEWLERIPSQDTAGPAFRVVATRRIAEVGGLTNVSRLGIVSSKGSTRLEVEHASIDVEGTWTLCATIGEPGKYAAAKGRCRRAG